jgi:hypothetical protein
MDLPLRAKNEMLTAAGFSPGFRESRLEDDTMSAGASRALNLILDRHEPFPVLVMDGRFDIVRTNRAADRFLDLICADPSRLDGTVNGYHLFLHPDLGRHALRRWPEVAALLIGFLRQNTLRHPDRRALAELYDEVLALPDVAAVAGAPDLDVPATGVFTFHFECDGFEGAFLTTLTTFVAPNDVTLEELSIETYFPLDEATSEACRRDLGQPG